MGEWVTPLVGLAGTILGGSGLAILNHWLGKTKRVHDLGKDLRDELRAEMSNLRTELRKEAEDADNWRAKYWELKYGQQLINYKTEKTAKIVDEAHPEKHLKDDLDGIGC